MYSAPEPLAREPCQPQLERSAARVVVEQRSVDAARARAQAARVVVTGSSAAAVIENQPWLRLNARRVNNLKNLLGELIGDRAQRSQVDGEKSKAPLPQPSFSYSRLRWLQLHPRISSIFLYLFHLLFDLTRTRDRCPINSPHMAYYSRCPNSILAAVHCHM